jgi:hypothetical protein
MRVADHYIQIKQPFTKKLHDFDAFPICNTLEYVDKLPASIQKNVCSFFFPMSDVLLPFLALLL